MKTGFNRFLVAASAAFAFNAATAHGPGEPIKHGSTLAAAGDLGFELVSQGDGVTLYIDDHGKPLPTSGMKGKLTVLSGTNKAEAELLPSAPNKLEAKGVKLSSGAKAVAAVTLPNQKVVTVRFAVK